MIIVSALAFLAACASPTPNTSPPSPSAAAPVPSEDSARAARMLATAGRADAPSRREVERVLGAPDIARQEGAGAAWTYRLDSCALMLLFAADARNELRLAEVAPSARQSGGAAPSLDQCAAEVTARRRS